MEIREAKPSDIPAIVNLLKISLGESLMPKSDRYWRWKHIENPFGVSPVLLCWDGNTLAGVRAFMNWQWSYREKVYKAVRAVDTATHPEYQGKGIFKKLTLALVHSCKERGTDFVFNTPNKQSKPGYLKMGWNEAGRLPIAMDVRSPLRMAKNFFSQQKRNEVVLGSGGWEHILNNPKLPLLIKTHQRAIDKLVTNITADYLKWRYLDVPVTKYVAMQENGADMSLIIGRIKESRLGRELRITDCFLDQGSSQVGLRKKVKNCLKLWDIDYVTVSGLLPQPLKIISKLGLKAPVGPTVTIRPINLLDLSNLERFSHWAPSLGDLELF